MFLRLIKAVTQWQMFPSGDPPKTKNFSAKFHAPSINSLEYRSNPLSYPLKYSFKCSSSSSQKSRKSFPFPAPFPCILFRGWSLHGWTRRIRGTREGGSSKKGASLSFFLYTYGGQSGERTATPSVVHASFQPPPAKAAHTSGENPAVWSSMSDSGSPSRPWEWIVLVNARQSERYLPPLSTRREKERERHLSRDSITLF